MNLIKYIKLIGVIFIGMSLSSCTDYEKTKTFLQSEYDKINPMRDMAICYYVGNVTYPYINQPITYFLWDGLNKTETKKLNEVLPAFTQVGLLQEIEPGIGEDGQSYPQYTLTELGEKYRWSFERDWGGGDNC